MAMEKQTEQDIHDMSYECFRELESLENTPTYEHNAKSISPIDKLRKLRAICRLYAAKCDELELKLLEDGTDQ